ncbi:MAG: radical SAM protein, partial [Myxococcota bacterium]
MQYVPPLFRPPSEANAFILQATLGCSWNNCTYCHMYRSKSFTIRPVPESIADIQEAVTAAGPRIRKVFVADGDALIMPVETWLPLLAACKAGMANLKRVSCYATADNVVLKGLDALRTLRDAGLSRIYIGPESGDEATLRRLAKGPRLNEDRDTNYLFDRHAQAAQMARQAGIEVSAIFLLGAGGVARSAEHAHAS